MDVCCLASKVCQPLCQSFVRQSSTIDYTYYLRIIIRFSFLNVDQFYNVVMAIPTYNDLVSELPSTAKGVPKINEETFKEKLWICFSRACKGDHAILKTMKDTVKQYASKKKGKTVKKNAEAWECLDPKTKKVGSNMVSIISLFSISFSCTTHLLTSFCAMTGNSSTKLPESSLCLRMLKPLMQSSRFGTN